jgi:hypothetical protein
MTRRPILTGLAAGFLVLATMTGTAHATGPGGWGHIGHGATAGTASLDGSVFALNDDKPGGLFVGGNFTTAGGVADTNRVARWNGTHWNAVSTGSITSGVVNAIAYDSTAGKVYVGGSFTNAGTNPDADFIAVSSGGGWATVCRNGATPLVTATVTALQIIGRTLYVGGSFADGGGIPSADRLVACNMDTGDTSPTVDSAVHEFNGGINALAADSNGVLYAGGSFQNLEGNTQADHVAYMDGTGWHAMGSGGGTCGCAVDDFVRSFLTIGTDVYVGTDSKDVAGIAKADNVVKWNGSAWSALGANTAGTDGWFPYPTTINGLTHHGADIYATGAFVNADGKPTADEIAVFSGGSWHPLGANNAAGTDGPLDARGNAAVFFDSRLYVGGNFTTAGGDPLAHGLAAYPGYKPVCTNINIPHATGGQPVHIRLTCTDQGGLKIHYGKVSGPLHGKLTNLTDGGKVDYTPDVGHVGSDHFTFQGRNADGTSNTATVTINNETAGYSNAGTRVAMASSALTASSSGALKMGVHNKNTFAIHTTLIKMITSSHGTFVKSHTSKTLHAGQSLKLPSHLLPGKLADLKRLGHVRVTVTVTFTGPHGSHSKTVAKRRLNAPR